MATELKNFIGKDDVIHEDFPWCHVEWMSKPGLTDARQLILVRSEFPVGMRHRFHYHPGREEIIYILSGQALQWVGQDKRTLGPGDMAHIPAEVPHSTINVGTEPLHFLAILSPAETGGAMLVDVFDQEPWSALERTT